MADALQAEGKNQVKNGSYKAKYAKFSSAKLRMAGEAQPGSAADLVLSAAVVRFNVHFLARIQHGGIPTDVWLDCVMRHATALV